MRLLLTRPEEDAAPLADELSALGHSVVLAPMMRVRFVDGMVPDLDGVQAVLLTSANGARALARATGGAWSSAFVAGAFALHPLQVEAVAWAAARGQVLSGLFFALALVAYERQRRSGGAGPRLAVIGCRMSILVTSLMFGLIHAYAGFFKVWVAFSIGLAFSLARDRVGMWALGQRPSTGL